MEKCKINCYLARNCVPGRTTDQAGAVFFWLENPATDGRKEASLLCSVPTTYCFFCCFSPLMKKPRPSAPALTGLGVARCTVSRL